MPGAALDHLLPLDKILIFIIRFFSQIAYVRDTKIRQLIA